MTHYKYETVNVDIIDKVAHVQMNRPKKLNAFSPGLIRDVRAVFRALAEDSNIGAIVVSGSGRMFSAGLDLGKTDITSAKDGDLARLAYNKRAHLKDFQAAFTAIEDCEKPVIAAVHGGCYGAGVDMVTACDMRYCSKDALFCVKEVDVGLAADVGTLQRLPKVIGSQSLVRELCYTARNLYADEALQHGLVNRVFDNQEQLIAESLKMAALIASKSPVAVVGTKHNLLYSRDHSVAEGLAYTVTWSSAMLNTEDIPKSFVAFVNKKPATYSKL
ncbi:ClpP/crotonase-like domain-containing protein [Chlamydoabsidia padenii]|nr:ClpP/crotonase-like domain-containing protein [Chlamydoabsidia padenii]